MLLRYQLRPRFSGESSFVAMAEQANGTEGDHLSGDGEVSLVILPVIDHARWLDLQTCYIASFSGNIPD